MVDLVKLYKDLFGSESTDQVREDAIKRCEGRLWLERPLVSAFDDNTAKTAGGKPWSLYYQDPVKGPLMIARYLTNRQADALRPEWQDHKYVVK